MPIESLVKCKMQDNLEFLQWSKRYWDQYFPGGEYDAIQRRKGAGAPTSAPAGGRLSTGTSTAKRGTTPVTAARPGGVKAGGAASSALVSENAQLKETVQGLERERDFYFQKLREIELLIQTAVENDPKVEEEDGGLVKQIQAILYSTEVRVVLHVWLHNANNLCYRRALKFHPMPKGPLTIKRPSEGER